MTLNSGSRFKIIGIGALALVFSVADLAKDVRDYRRAGSRPNDMTLAQAREASIAAPSVRRWVRLTEPLQLECGQAVQQTEDGKVTAIVILAADPLREQPFLLDYEQDAHDCEQLKSTPLEGMLVEPSVKFWTTHGMTVPSMRYPLMGLRVGQDPTGLLKEAEVLFLVALVAIALLWFGYVSRPKKVAASPEKAFANAAR